MFHDHIHLSVKGSEALSRAVASELARIMREGRAA